MPFLTEDLANISSEEEALIVSTWPEDETNAVLIADFENTWKFLGENIVKTRIFRLKMLLN
jgi:hypothetical protein